LLSGEVMNGGDALKREPDFPHTELTSPKIAYPRD
jgi:hypothetical protein